MTLKTHVTSNSGAWDKMVFQCWKGRAEQKIKKIVPGGLDCLLEQLSPESYTLRMECAMTAECLSIKKKELIKTIRSNYFNQRKVERIQLCMLVYVCV